jgi:hypothetical protein
MALDHFKATGDVLTWLYKQALSNLPYDIPGTEILLRKKDGLHVETAQKICMSTFENDIARVTLEITKPDVTEVGKDIKVTFPDMLGTIGLSLHFMAAYKRIY